MMKLKALLTPSLVVAILSGAAMAQTTTPAPTSPAPVTPAPAGSLTQSIANDLSAAGYTQVSITRTATGINVVASGPNGTVTQTYGLDGTLLSATAGGDAPGAGAGTTATATTGMRHGDDDDHDGGDHDRGEGDHDRGEGDHDGGEGDHD